MRYLYRHIRLDKNEVFYVGIGTIDKKYLDKCMFSTLYSRAFTKKNRNKHWHNIVRKTEYEVEIMLESDNYDFIKQKEVEFIALYGRKDLGKGKLVNLTDGGEGSINYKHTEEALIKMLNNIPRKYGKDNTASQPVIDTLSLQIYECAADAAKSLGFKPINFTRWLRGERRNPTYCVYLRDYVEGEIHQPSENRKTYLSQKPKKTKK